MAEASNGVQSDPLESGKESANGAAGPNSDNFSLSPPTEDMSIHLSPRETRGRSSPKPTRQPARMPLARPRHMTRPRNLSPLKAVEARNRARQMAEKQSDKCEMCEQFYPMKARCLTCQSNMCENCVEHHKKMKIAADHELQDWETHLHNLRLGVESKPKTPPPSKTDCKTHKGEKLQFYCRVCMIPLCINCKLTKHEGHKTRDLFEEMKEQRDVLPLKLNQLKASILPLLKQQIKELEDADKELKYNVQTTIENIQKRTKFVKDEIDKASARLIGKLKDKEQKAFDQIESKRRTLNTYLKSATAALNSGDRIVQTGDDFEVMELYQNLIDILKKIQELVKRRPGKQRYVFQDGQFTQNQLFSMFGNYAEKGPKLEQVVKKTRSLASLQVIPEIQGRLITTILCKSVPGNKVSAIAPINEKEAWISFGWTTNEIFLYNKDGYRQKRLTLRGPVDDITADQDGNLLVSGFTSNVVRIVDRRLQVRDFFQCPLKCRGLAVSSARQIIVCGVDKCTALPPPSKCTIFKFTAKGNKTGHLDGDKNKHIPIHPYRVTENIDGSIALTDWVNDKEGRVVVFSHDGKVRMVYYGDEARNAREKRSFLPYGIASDKYGHILVGDIINQEVHLLDIKGHFQRVLLTREDLENERPYSLAVDSMDMLWVGNERATIKIYRYLIHQAHIV